MSVELRRFVLDPDLDPAVHRLGIITNRLVDMANGSSGGRVWLLGDDGDRKELLGGGVIDSNNYPLRVEPGSTNQLNVIGSNGSTVGLRVQDTGLTTGVPASLTSTLAVTGASTLTGALAANGGTTTTTLTASGATLLNGAVTLGDAAGDAITVTGTAAFAEDVTLAKGLIVDTTTLVVDETTNFVAIGGATPGRPLHVVQAGSTIQTLGAGSSVDDVIVADGATPTINIVYSGAYGTLTFSTASAQKAYVWWDGAANTLKVEAASAAHGVMIGGAAGGLLGFFATAPVARPAAGAAATDLASVITLANSLRTGLRSATGVGLFS